MGHARRLVVESWAAAADFDNGLPALLKSNALVRPNIPDLNVTKTPSRRLDTCLLSAGDAIGTVAIYTAQYITYTQPASAKLSLA